MTAVDSNTAFNAFQEQLKTLCLTEFPCGIGSWNENYGKKRKQIEKDKVNTRFTITLKDFGPEHEKTETLEELVTSKHSPWNLDYSWSDEAKQLREIAVQSPWLVDQRFILKHFKTLRIINKEVVEIDKNFLKFANLEELTLSANKLVTVNSRNLPPKLKVLEICANQISDLADLCVKPPPLMHLGLGYNTICMVDDYISGEYWPKLLSLDLSHNNLTDLMDIVRKLQSLPKLRNLILQGNPLALIPGYRGYTIDSLRDLSFLDDISISADEKHHYKGLAKRKEYILDEAKVTLSVPYIKGVPMPEELKNPDEQPEFPVVTKKYLVQFMYLEDKSANAEIFQLLHDDNLSSMSPTQTQDAETCQTTGDTGAPDGISRLEGSIMGDSGDPDSNTNVANDLSSDGNQPVLPVVVQPPTPSGGSVGNTVDFEDQPEAGSRETGETQEGPAMPPIKLAAINSVGATWAEEMELNWSQIVVRDDLLALRDFFKQGMDIVVLEEKIQSYPADMMQDGAMSPDKEGKDGKGKGDKKKDDKDKGKDAKGKSSAKTKKKVQKSAGKNDSKDDSKKKNKKKGEPDVEMVDMPSEFTTLATFHVTLEDLLDGDYELETVFTHDLQADQAAKEEDAVGELKTIEAKKSKTKPSSAKPGKDRDPRKSPKPDKKDGKDKDGKDAKGKGKGSSNDQMGEEDGPPPPPPPLEVKIKLRLHHWRTALDSMKAEQENEEEEEGQQA